MRWRLFFVFCAASKLWGFGFGANLESECIDGSIFIAINDTTVTFDEAKTQCEQLNPALDSVLAAIRNLEQFEAAFDLVNDSLVPKNDDAFWVGIEDKAKAGGQNTARFSFVSSDQTGFDDFINRGVSEFPWGRNQPNDADGEQDCTTLRKDPNEANLPRLDDDKCSKSRNFICSSLCPPTSSPTLSPTSSPTLSPTRNPSVSPTFEPTRSPNAAALLGDQEIILLNVVSCVIVLFTLGFLFIALRAKQRKMAMIQMEGQSQTMKFDPEGDDAGDYLSMLGTKTRDTSRMSLML